MNKSVDLVIVSDCINEAEALCQSFEDAGLSTAIALGPVNAAQTIRLTRPRLVLIVSSRLAGDDACAVLRWLRTSAEECIFACLIDPDSANGSAHYKQAGFDFCFRLPLPEQVAHALAESVKSVRSLGISAPARQRAPAQNVVDVELPVAA